jgi:acyl-CoA synthetase (AMP-forming)/AMP-acid ligase II
MIEAVDFGLDAPALVEESPERSVSYRELGRRVKSTRAVLASQPRPALAFQFAGNGPDSVVSYLACLAEGIPLGLGDSSGALRARVIGAYQPTLLFLPSDESAAEEGYEPLPSQPEGGLVVWRRRDRAPYPVSPNPALALLLATSGSTGDVKFVRLSRANLLANALSISQYLGLSDSERAVQSLPMSYSYGLSVLNSHLVSGASVAFSAHSFMRPEFWRAVDSCGCTSFAGVPYMYETLARLGINPAEGRSVRTLTQAGGHLKVDLVRRFHHAAEGAGARMFVMYGQTEATARISYVPPERLAEKAGSIGIAIPSGQLSLRPVDGDPATSQIWYSGPNVMLGYATCPGDLALGDDLGGVLATGDLGERDGDGFFRITGRLSRFAKLFGKRVNLAMVESEVEVRFPVRAAAVDAGDRIRVFVERGDAATTGSVRSHVASFLGVPPVTIVTEAIELLPMTASGKKDYKALA